MRCLALFYVAIFLCCIRLTYSNPCSHAPNDIFRGFLLQKTKISKKGKAPVYARITTSGLSTEIYTRCQIEPERWNQRLERSLYKDEIDLRINDIIASYRANILAAYDRLIREGKEPNCFAIKQRLENPNGNSRMFLAEFSKYCDKRQREVGVRITQLTANKYHRLLRYMTEYTKGQYRKDDLPLDAIDYAYIDGLNTFMQTAHNCRNNGAVNLLCCLKNFILYAIRNEWIEKNPFRYYKMKVDKTNVKVPLTREELDTLLRKPMPNDRLDRIRDVFCFCALTGLAFTDADHLRKGAYHDRRRGYGMDSQAEGKDGGNEPCAVAAAGDSDTEEVRIRRDLQIPG